MLRRFLAAYTYSETVGGEPREFVHETIIHAADPVEAKRLAIEQFAGLELNSGVGWVHVLKRCDVVAAQIDATPRGGRRVHRDPEIES